MRSQNLLFEQVSPSPIHFLKTFPLVIGYQNLGLLTPAPFEAASVIPDDVHPRVPH